MSSTPYALLCKELYAHFINEFQRSQDDTYRFAIEGTAESILDRRNLIRFFECLHSPDSSNLSLALNAEILASRVEDKKLQKFLAILVFSTFEIEPAHNFTNKLLVTGSLEAESCSLPTNRLFLTELFEEEITPDQFLSKQAIFCPVMIVKGIEVPIQSLEQQRLPFIEEKLRGNGSFATVYAVKIAKGHFYDPNLKSSNKEPVELARRDFIINDSESLEAQENHEIIKIILSLAKHENIVKSLGSIIVGSSTYSLLMPLAICDLEDYMTEHHKDKANTPLERLAVIQNARGLAGGLGFLHTQMKTKDGDELVCYHMDLKPANILVYQNGNSTSRDYIWKISDFGMSRIKVRQRGQNEVRVRGFRNWFAQRAKAEPQNMSAAPPTMNHRWEGTYLPPESMASFPTMTTRSDVWSFGCVISVVFTFLEEGSHGLEVYSGRRSNHRKSNGYDRFFVHDKHMSSAKVHHPAIKEWHTELINKAMARSRLEGSAVQSTLRFLEDEIFQDQKNRCYAQTIEDNLKETCKLYNEVIADPGEPGERLSPLDFVLENTGLNRLLSRKDEPHLSAEVEKQFLEVTDPFKGCEISPDGSVVAFWTDNNILIYTSESSLGSKDPKIRPVDTWVLKNQLESRMLKSIALMEDYLVASTSGGFQYYLFDLPEIARLAISPDGATIAFALRGDEKDTFGALYYARRTSPKNCKKLKSLDRPTTDIAHMAFQSNDDLYWVVRPDSSLNAHSYGITLFHLSLRTNMSNSLIIESKDVDHTSNVGLFTTFSPFYPDLNTCIVVTREKKLHIQSLSLQNKMTSFQHDIKDYRVLRIMVSQKYGKILAVGRPQASHKILLLELKWSQKETHRSRGKGVLHVEELTSLPGLLSEYAFKERLCETNDESIVLIASLTVDPSGYRAMYRINVKPWLDPECKDSE
ncbi:uncharacterized protein N7483_009185 [Penicillium malachiteum]|uniref:uncharacterized protein n=1 Tax=Penicillium malachiteum TaxID=1324776 RepID=UPI0025485078|nr:uncharacterized protein N7483_009185 [Penicillium malachiteum]KAJ5721251.1 hypothetical protein N7483_009185 [Penicillium malachiteum]